MKEVLHRSVPKQFQVALESRHEDHIVKHYDVVPFLAYPNTIDQLLVVGSAESQHFSADWKDLIEADGKIVDLGCCVDRTENQLLKWSIIEQFFFVLQWFFEYEIADVLDGFLEVQPSAEEVYFEGRLVHKSLEESMTALLVFLSNYLD